jgi:hypothetical protein
VYKKASLMYGGSLERVRSLLNWKKSHGPIKIKRQDGQQINKELPGDFSLSCKCEYCGDLFWLKVPVFLVFTEERVFSYRRKYGLFCKENCARAWLKKYGSNPERKMEEFLGSDKCPDENK